MTWRGKQYGVCLAIVAVAGVLAGVWSIRERADNGGDPRFGSADDEVVHPPHFDFPDFARKRAGATTGTVTAPTPSHSEQPAVRYFRDRYLATMSRSNDREEGVAYLLADGRVQSDESAAGIGLDTDAVRPGPLKPPHDASPIPEHDPALDEATRKVIANELPHASDEEREVWFEELRGLSGETIREILRLRRRIDGRRQQIPRLQSTVFPPPATESSPRPSESVVDHQPIEPEIQHRLQPTLAALQQACGVFLHNIANAQTIGYKRLLPIFEDRGLVAETAASLQVAAGAMPQSISPFGVKLQGMQLDMSQGRLLKTGRSFDVAIAGEGFFQVAAGEERHFTRTGTLSLADGKLVLFGAGVARPLIPEVLVPTAATTLHISVDGTVTARTTGDTEPINVGTIQLVRFLDPSSLQPRGGGLLAATDASGPPQPGTAGAAGYGRLRQGCLEQSNVAIADEMLSLQRLRVQLQAIRQTETFHVDTRHSGHDN